jgi:molybdenum cofactor cytidylyltransferase/nicotine blue oxidoreductase
MTVSSESSKGPLLRLAILILAAGEGSRLGGIPKALLKKDGSSLLKRFIYSTVDLDPIETLVVTGFYSEKIQAEITSLQQDGQSPLSWIRNPNPEAGQASSVRLGIESLKSQYDVLLIALCDQPNIGKQEIESLLEQFKQKSPEQEIILPMIHGQRGNPVLFSRAVIKKVLAIPGMVCRPYMDDHPELVKTFLTDNQAYLQDVDTQADIQKLGIESI